MSLPEWPASRAAAWIDEAPGVAVLFGGALARAAGIDVTVGGARGEGFRRQPERAALEAAGAVEAARRAPLPPAAVAIARLLASHPQAGAVALEPDGFLLRAGAHPTVELRGSLLRRRCAACGFGPLGSEHPCCLACGGAPRPDVVLVDEVLDPRRRLEAEYLVARAKRILAVGVGGPAWSEHRGGDAEPASSRPEASPIEHETFSSGGSTARALLRAAVEDGAEVLVIGPSPGELSRGTVGVVAGDPDRALPALLDAWVFG